MKYLDANMTSKSIRYMWKESDEYEAARVAGTYMEVKERFFQHHHFCVLPYPAPYTVYLPPINYDMLLAVTKAATYYPDSYDRELITEVSHQLAKVAVNSTCDTVQIRKKFLDIQRRFETSLHRLFPTLFPSIQSITIIPTRFGTEGSFDYRKNGGKYELFIWIRNTGVQKDSIIAQLVHCIVSSLVLIADRTPDSNTHAWKQREAIVDFLLGHTELQSVWKQIHKTLPIIESHQTSQAVRTDADLYMKKLAFNLVPPRISKKGDVFMIDTNPLDRMGDKEQKLFSILYSQKNKFVEKDIILDSLYGEDGGSDWSLSKLVERLRQKIKAAGIAYPLLLTSRRQGYMLVTS